MTELLHSIPGRRPCSLSEAMGCARPNPGIPRSQSERASKEFRKYATILDGNLADKRFVTGDTLTLADFSIGVVFGYIQPLQLPVDGLEHLQRWWSALSGTPSGKILLPG